MTDPLHTRLSRRESQIVEAVRALGEASITDIQERLPDPPGTSAIRVMVGGLVRRDVLVRRRDGRRNLYALTEGPAVARKRGLAYVRERLFGGSAADVVAALLESGDVSTEELDQLADLVERAREGKDRLDASDSDA